MTDATRPPRIRPSPAQLAESHRPREGGNDPVQHKRPESRPGCEHRQRENGDDETVAHRFTRGPGTYAKAGGCPQGDRKVSPASFMRQPATGALQVAQTRTDRTAVVVPTTGGSNSKTVLAGLLIQRGQSGRLSPRRDFDFVVGVLAVIRVRASIRKDARLAPQVTVTRRDRHRRNLS